MTPKKHPLAVARDEWLFSPEGQQCFLGVADPQFQRNRLEMAFIAGWDAAMTHTAPLRTALLDICATWVPGTPYHDYQAAIARARAVLAKAEASHE